MPADPLVRDTFLPWHEPHRGARGPEQRVQGVDNHGARAATWACTRSVAEWLARQRALELLRPPAPRASIPHLPRGDKRLRVVCSR